jgi:hypothetical protein
VVVGSGVCESSCVGDGVGVTVGRALAVAGALGPDPEPGPLWDVARGRSVDSGVPLVGSTDSDGAMLGSGVSVAVGDGDGETVAVGDGETAGVSSGACVGARAFHDPTSASEPSEPAATNTTSTTASAWTRTPSGLPPPKATRQASTSATSSAATRPRLTA